MYIRSCQVKTCAIGPDLELHNSNYMSHFLYSQNPFLKAYVGTHNWGKCAHSINMYASGKGALRRHKTTKSKGIGMSTCTRTAIATRFLYVFIVFGMILLFGIDWNSFFSEKYHTIKEWWGIFLRIAKSGTVRQIRNPASVGWDCELEPLPGQTFHQDYYP